jgi:hypothetical protein
LASAWSTFERLIFLGALCSNWLTRFYLAGKVMVFNRWG